jgi:cytoskeletal protein CcmA (bactofilin family)
MNKFIFLIVFFIVAFLFPRTISAQSRNELLPANTRIQSDYIRTAETIQIDGEIEGDVFLSGGVITINGKIGGDLFAIGGKVTVNGEVGNSIRINFLHRSK